MHNPQPCSTGNEIKTEDECRKAVPLLEGSYWIFRPASLALKCDDLDKCACFIGTEWGYAGLLFFADIPNSPALITDTDTIYRGKYWAVCHDC